MCDVAFLLLTFFAVASTAKIPEALFCRYILLQQFKGTKLPSTGCFYFNLVGDGKVFLRFERETSEN
jgi:hypothetical protein